mmetsp:Transcript_30089/g.87362  ORF Transcript_30089/g.87362 Transcript_30089/m.87362 type:complete len:212 (-) Transcript_30089:1265-1900(-)
MKSVTPSAICDSRTEKNQPRALPQLVLLGGRERREGGRKQNVVIVIHGSTSVQSRRRGASHRQIFQGVRPVGDSCCSRRRPTRRSTGHLHGSQKQKAGGSAQHPGERGRGRRRRLAAVHHHGHGTAVSLLVQSMAAEELQAPHQKEPDGVRDTAHRQEAGGSHFGLSSSSDVHLCVCMWVVASEAGRHLLCAQGDARQHIHRRHGAQGRLP